MLKKLKSFGIRLLAVVELTCAVGIVSTGCASATADDHGQQMAVLKAEYATLTTGTWRVMAIDPYVDDHQQLSGFRVVFERSDDRSVRRAWAITYSNQVYENYKDLAVGDVVRLVSRRQWDETKEDEVNPRRIDLKRYMRPERIP